MPRGRLLKTIAKEAREVAKAKVIGAEKGQMQVDRVKYNLKNIGLQLKKRILEVDPSTGTKLIATIGITIAIKEGIDWGRIIVSDYLWLASYSSIPFANFLGVTIDLQEIKEKEGSIGSEIASYLISFGLAYLIVENFGEIVTALGTGLSSVVGLAKTLMGAGLVPV